MTALWGVAGLAAIIWVVTLRLSVRLMGRELDNGWDNALGYAVVSALALSAALSALGTGWLAVLAPLIVVAVQIGSLSFIYEVDLVKAFLLGLLHSALFSATTVFSALVGGAIAIYLLYGKIISDPMVIIRVILRWLGIEWPL